jgi:hypothetical protein
MTSKKLERHFYFGTTGELVHLPSSKRYDYVRYWRTFDTYFFRARSIKLRLILRNHSEKEFMRATNLTRKLRVYPCVKEFKCRLFKVWHVSEYDDRSKWYKGYPPHLKQSLITAIETLDSMTDEEFLKALDGINREECNV